MQGIQMAVGFVDLERAYDTVPREMVMATVRWTVVPEAEARMVEAMYERTKGRVVVGSGLSEEFPVNIGLRQGSVLSPLLFFRMMELISRKISMKDVLRKMMCADDLAIIAENKQELQEVLKEWNGVFKKHGLRMSLEKTEVMWVGHQREELNIRLDVPWRNSYGGWAFRGRSATSDTSGSECLEKGRGSHVGQHFFLKAEGESPESVCYTGMPVWSGDSGGDRACVTPACLYGLKTVALTEQQQKLQVSENDWVRRITRTKRVDKRRMNDLRKEAGMQCSLTGRLVRSRMRWAGHL